MSTTSRGLSEDEAYQQLLKFGTNELPEPAHRPLWLRFTGEVVRRQVALNTHK